MPFIPHTDDDIAAMLKAIGTSSIESLFEEIPKNLRIKKLENFPHALNEMAISHWMHTLAAKDNLCLNFIGAGAYEHHIPAAVWSIASRGEWMTAYTPYQAEASQGTLQLLYEYQSMMTRLMATDVSNGSLYDGGSGLAEAILMAARCSTLEPPYRILMPSTVHPFYRQAVHSLTAAQPIEIIDVPYCKDRGVIDPASLSDLKLLKSKQPITAIVIPQPNFFGRIEEADAITDWARKNKILVIGLVNPIAMALLKPPGLWGTSTNTMQGADIICGEGQPLGIPLASGGPYFGFLCCKKEYIRQLPGRLVGRTVDNEGKEGFTLTLQAREQHIRRAKATSNICTNQGLLVTAATIYMSLLGPKGLQQVGKLSHINMRYLSDQIKKIPSIQQLFSAQPFFHELVLKLPIAAKQVIQALAKMNIQAGFDLETEYPEMKNCLLVCVTETKTKEEIDRFVNCLKICC